MNARLLFIHALSPLHPGTGQGVGVIDLPVAREKATGLPYLPGSSVKGTLRDASDDGTPEGRRITEAIFGPPTSEAEKYAGSVQISDARLLLLPVRSVHGTFAWVSSPYVLRRFVRDARETSSGEPPAVPDPGAPTSEGEPCLVADPTCLSATFKLQPGQPEVTRVVLEDLDLVPSQHGAVTMWAAWLGDRLFPNGDADAEDWRRMLCQHLCIVRDDVLNFLLCTALEVTPRIALNPKTKTVDAEKGALWYEESLPVETVLTGLVVVTPTETARKLLDTAAIFEVLGRLTERSMQFGGKATVGRGVCRVRLGG